MLAKSRQTAAMDRFILSSSDQHAMTNSSMISLAGWARFNDSPIHRARFKYSAASFTVAIKRNLWIGLYLNCLANAVGGNG